jgi:hypothetical protein
MMSDVKEQFIDAILRRISDPDFLKSWASDSFGIAAEFGDDFPATSDAFDRSSDGYVGMTKSAFLKKARRDLLAALDCLEYDGDRLVVYRSLSGNKVQASAIGVYWAFDQECAEPYWGIGDAVPKLLGAYVSIDDIDMDATAALALNPYRLEKEIRLKAGRSIEAWDVVSGKMFPATT